MPIPCEDPESLLQLWAGCFGGLGFAVLDSSVGSSGAVPSTAECGGLRVGVLQAPASFVLEAKGSR